MSSNSLEEAKGILNKSIINNKKRMSIEEPLIVKSGS